MLQLFLSNTRQQIGRTHASGPLELGRGPERAIPRLTVEDPYASRDQLTLEELPDSHLRLTNIGGPVILQSGRNLAAGETVELLLPVQMTFGYSTLDVSVAEPIAEMRTTIHRTVVRADRSMKNSLQELGESPDAETLMGWFERLLAVQRAAAGTGEFYAETARAVVDLVGLDRGAVVLRRQDAWDVIAEHPPPMGTPKEISGRVITRVMEDRRTYFESFADEGLARSLAGIEAVVASPILDEQDSVVGVVYGTREVSGSFPRPGVKPLEAMVVQLLAAAVSAGLARLHQEAEASRNRIQFERFFSQELARALEQQPGLLLGQQREISVLFSDLRGFTTISERLGAERTFALLTDVLDRLTNCVMEQGGVIIDYYGDGLAAMWNAPMNQPDHPRRACEAGLKMLNLLPALNADWQEIIGVPVRVGIGIHTGLAYVGNSGSQHRLKYGPRGHTVNLASRLEAANKPLGTSLLISGDVAEQLDAGFQHRHLGSAYLPGVREPVPLFELVEPQRASEHWRTFRERYEEVWNQFAAGRLRESLELGKALIAEFGPGDQPTELLMQHGQAELHEPSAAFDPAFRLDRKQ